MVVQQNLMTDIADQEKNEFDIFTNVVCDFMRQSLIILQLK